jgi:lipopolysaccharide/colanic/teichoic acid biosynthesis glycosyltransferase
MRMDGVQIEEREAMYERLTGKIAVESMRPSYLIFGAASPKPAPMVIKRLLDIFTSLRRPDARAADLPARRCAAHQADSKGPVFFCQERTGQDGVPFKRASSSARCAPTPRRSPVPCGRRRTTAA